MISGNCNRSPQYAAMGPATRSQTQGHHYQNHPFGIQPQNHQQPNLMFMAGGSVRTFPQMSRGFSMMPTGGHVHPMVMQVNMQHGFGGGYQTTPAFHQPHHHPNHQYHQQPPQPHVSHYNLPPPPQQQQFIQQPYISPPPPVSNAPTSGFINGIKNMVKGIIKPLNCDFYTDHHKYYNPKYRNNYMREIGSDKMQYTSKPAEPHVQATTIDLELSMPSVQTNSNVPKPCKLAVPLNCPPKTADVTDVVAIFTSEDFPELPVPRKSRSITPAKTEKTPEPIPKESPKQASPPPPTPPPQLAEKSTPKNIFFEIECTTRPCGRRPTFGGRLNVVPPPFSLNKSPRTCQTRSQEATEDCDIEDESFVIFQRPNDCLLRSLVQSCRPVRQRQISECSDDSFVVFCTDDADCLAINDGEVADYDDDDDSSEDDDFDSDEETSSEEEDEDEEDDSSSDSGNEEIDNGTDVVDSSFLGRNKTDRNKCAGTTHFHTVGVCNSAAEQPDSGFDEKKKKVTFDAQPVVHVMHSWNFAYRAARKGHWEGVARDRTRFQQRIERTSVYLNPILTPEHREKIYHSRFIPGAENNQPQETPVSSDLGTGSPPQAASATSCSDESQRLPTLKNSPQCAKF